MANPAGSQVFTLEKKSPTRYYVVRVCSWCMVNNFLDLQIRDGWYIVRKKRGDLTTARRVPEYSYLKAIPLARKVA